MTAIIILNWNGWRDTLSCLDSLANANGLFRVLVVDNGSMDDSVEHIKDYMATHSDLDADLFETGENLGFAKGNNEGIRHIFGQWNADYYLLLNNDTVVEPDFLVNLEKFIHDNSQYKVLTPVICYDYNRSIVWNCGGWQKFGLRRYYYENQSISKVKELDPISSCPIKSHKDVTFLTGCALFFSSELLDAEHRLLTEDFFFGEEDFNFCLRMNQMHIKMACVMSAKIYHKVNGSVRNNSILAKTYIYYLNRYIDMRRHYSAIKYFFWKIVSSSYGVIMLSISGHGLVTSFRLIRRVLHESSNMNGVSKQYFFNSMKGFF